MVPNQAVLPSAPQWSLQANPLRTDIRLLFQAAMLVFVITVAIGILNGLHLVGQLSQDVLLTHVHAGTLGWITLSVFAVSLWLFGDGKAPTEKSSYVRVMSILAAVCIPLYVLAFLSGNFIARAVFGFPVLLLMIAFFGWIVARSLRVRLTVARLALLGALFTLIVGSVIGVLLQIQFATSNAFLPAGAFAAHPATQVVGYLLLVGMAISEWRFMPDTGRLPRAGVIQIAFPFIAGQEDTSCNVVRAEPRFRQVRPSAPIVAQLYLTMSRVRKVTMVLPLLPPAMRQVGYYRLTLLHRRILMEHYRSLVRRSIRPTEHYNLPMAPDR